MAGQAAEHLRARAPLMQGGAPSPLREEEAEAGVAEEAAPRP